MRAGSARGPARHPGVLAGCAAAGIAAGLAAQASIVTRGLIGWDVAVACFITIIVFAMLRTDLKTLKRRAEEYDGGRVLTLLVTLTGVAVSFGAIVSELSGGALKEPGGGWLAIFTIATIALSWTLVHLTFALHYAHEYYAPEDSKPAGGLKFPGDDEPRYGDFVHFSFVIGVAAQTADVQITSLDLRRIVTVQCIAAYVFNTAIVALLINIGASVISGN